MLTNARRSFVQTLRDWPRGTRRRGWGFLHDQVWFPVNVKEANVYMHDPDFDVTEQIMEHEGQWYRLYIDRKMLWFGWTLRLHTFYQGDDDAAPHDHPWWFVTFPLDSYTETVQKMNEWPVGAGAGGFRMNSRLVKKWRFHFRQATHRHFVHEPDRPIRTIVLTGRNRNDWAFYPEGKRVLHREWTSYDRGEEE